MVSPRVTFRTQAQKAGQQFGRVVMIDSTLTSSTKAGILGILRENQLFRRRIPHLNTFKK